MANPTETKFGDPANRIAQTAHWTVLLRPKQPTFGALVLVCREPVRAFSDVSAAGFLDLHRVVGRVERTLRAAVAYERINYLMLMMVDPDVHFHVLPRYATPRTFQDVAFPDAGWPGPPALDAAVTVEGGLREAMVTKLTAAWNLAGD